MNLPADVLLLICEELGNRQDFRTLFSCALTGKTFAGSALLWLYRIHNQASVLSSDGNDADLASGQNSTVQGRLDVQKRILSKWALQWKSIIRSSIGNGKTAYPYCLYIRSLDLRNLKYLLEETRFREVAFDDFFSDEMQKFLNAQETPIKKTRGSKASQMRLNIPAILDSVGESITSFVSESASQSHGTVVLEDLSGHISALALPKWTSRLSRLKSMTLWDGGVLNESVATAITSSCHHFDDLTIFTSESGTDHDLATFFSALRQHSLGSFAVLSTNVVGPETLLALNHHSQSLRVLKLDGLRSDAIKHLSLLEGCIALESLDLQDAEGLINLEATENDIFLEVVAWLGKCERLRDLHLKNFVSGPAILTQVCLRDNIKLRELEVEGYTLAGSKDFHAALAHQTSLESLKLKADSEDAFRDDIDTLVSAICELKNLKDLNLLYTSEYFRTPEIMLLAANLKNLEELWFGGSPNYGYNVTDDVWKALSPLPLRSLNIHALSSFSFDGILAFIDSLREDINQGLLLSIMNQDADYGLTEQEQVIIRESIIAKVDGQFDYVLVRDAESDSEDFSD